LMIEEGLRWGKVTTDLTDRAVGWANTRGRRVEHKVPRLALLFG